jgi:proline dehydrogenase
MAIGRAILLWASRSPLVARALRRRGFVNRAVRRFMPGESLDAALLAAGRLTPEGIGAVLTKLGENVSTLEEAAGVRDHYLDVLGKVSALPVPGEISVKLTQLGLDVDRAWCERALGALVSRAGERGSFVWIDMEDSRYTAVTLDVFRRARETSPSVGLCLQAYLRRTPRDLDSLLQLSPAIRLVKGAYAEPPAVAYPRKRDVDAAYEALAGRLLEAASRGGVRPVFGTHDMRLVARIRERARALGIPPRRHEFHQLYGIAQREQRALAGAGEAVRVLISYGAAWFAWYMRRLAERPANVWFVLRNLV